MPLIPFCIKSVCLKCVLPFFSPKWAVVLSEGSYSENFWKVFFLLFIQERYTNKYLTCMRWNGTAWKSYPFKRKPSFLVKRRHRRHSRRNDCRNSPIKFFRSVTQCFNNYWSKRNIFEKISVKALWAFKKDQKIQTEINEDGNSLSCNSNENELSISTRRSSVYGIDFEQYESLNLFNKSDFIWPSAIERLKVADIRNQWIDKLY